jgi:hypothetical protein
MLKAKRYDVKILNKNRHVRVESGDQKQPKKRSLFTYSGNEVRSVTKIFTKN